MGAKGQEAETAVEVSADTAPEGVNWADLAVDTDGDDAFVFEPAEGDSSQDDSTEPPGADSQESSDSKPAATPPQPEPVSTQKEPTPQVAQQPVAQSPAQPTQPQPQAAPPVDPAEMRAKYVEGLMTEYALSQEDALALATQPETVMPRIAANMHMRVMQDVAAHVQQVFAMVPEMLKQQLAQQEAESSAKQEFYSAWPGLSEHHAAVVANARMVRQANPNATRQQVIDMAGVLTATALGLDPNTLKAKPAATTQVRQTVPVQQARPPKPAAVGSSPNPVATESPNIFGQFAEEDEDWLRG